MSLYRPLTDILFRPSQLSCLSAVVWKAQFHRTAVVEDERPFLREPTNWLKYNEVVYPPTKPGEEERPAEICHARMQIKYSPKKLWYIAAMVRGLSVEEGIKQMMFHSKKGGSFVKEVLEEAQEIAVREHNVEYRSNLWIADSFVGKGQVVKGFRKHKGPRFGIIHYRYVNYFVRLREGLPPKHYYPPDPSGWEQMETYLKEMRSKRIVRGL